MSRDNLPGWVPAHPKYSENPTAVAGPDFYAYYDTEDSPGHHIYDAEYFDTLHPNGVGYQSMAELWKDILILLP